MLVYKRSCDLPKSLTLTLIKCFLCFLGITGVNGQAFTFSKITLSRQTSSVGATLQASCNATYWASTQFVMDWKINNTAVGLYQITDNKVPQLANGTHHYDVVFSAPTTTINTGDTFEVNLEIRNLKLNDNQAAISVTCTNCVQVSTLINVTECQLDNSNGVIASDVVSPCGLGCQVQYSCEIGYNGPIINATCLADATFDATPSCVQITCPAKNICSQPQYCFDVTMSNYNTTVLRQCEDGYNGTVTATCGIDSNWDVSSQCQAICNVFNISSNTDEGRCVSETANVVQGHSVNVTCCDGFNGTATIATCLSNRMWDNLPTCNRIPGNTDPGLSVGAKVGIALGVICGSILLIILIWILILLFCRDKCCCKLEVCGRDIGKKASSGKVYPDIHLTQQGEITKENQKDKKSDGSNGSETTHP